MLACSLTMIVVEVPCSLASVMKTTSGRIDGRLGARRPSGWEVVVCSDTDMRLCSAR
jgi:hypothetical protein